MSTSASVPITQGDATGGKVAVYTISEAAETRELQRIVLSDSTGAEVNTAMGVAGTPAGGVSTVQGQTGMTPVDTNLKQIGGATAAVGHGVAATALRVELPTDGTGVVGLIAGAAKIGVVTTDQTTHGTTDLVASDNTKVSGTAILTGNGTTGAGSQRVTVASDNTPFPVKIDQTTPGTTNAVALTSGAFDVATTITRPANVTAYTANDVLGGALDLGVLGPSAGAVQITSVQLEADIAAIPAGQTSWVLHFYNVTPPSAIADNGAFDVASGDRASYLGNIAIATMADLGSTLYVEANNVGKQLKLSGTHIFAYLVTVGGFTPAANSEVYKLTIHTVSL